MGGTLLSVTLSLLTLTGATPDTFRPPAVPLVTIDPYTSAWSFSDRLNESWPCHWTGASYAMTGLLFVDGQVFRFMGPEGVCSQAAEQTSLDVWPTQSRYRFEAAGVRLAVTFLTPMLPSDLTLISRPVTYITYDATATDGKEHDVRIYFDATAEWTVNKPEEKVTWSRPEGPKELTLLRFGSEAQPVLAESGDDIRINWGYFHLAVPVDYKAETVFGKADEVRKAFCEKGHIPTNDWTEQPRAAADGWPVMASVISFGPVNTEPVSRHLLLAYDDVNSIEYMHNPLRAWWWKHYDSFNAMLAAAARDYDTLVPKCAAFDTELMAAAESLGGPQYARLIGLSYRHVFASGKIVISPNDTPWFFHKECFSNGCVTTVDVSYPASPFFALFAPTLLRGMMDPIFDFARSEQWTFPFAPHDVGQYPKANGQVYHSGELEGQMPVEECGNMILMAALSTFTEGNASYAEKHWDLLTRWADYLKEKGLDPENQLCTDDFAGHLAHNANLSLKAINALGAYAKLASMLGKPEATTYRDAAVKMAEQWVKMADDGDHYRLTFDKPDSWSQKYNLVWDKLFDLGLFPTQVARKEIAYYLKIQNSYGIPLDIRKDYTKSDWLVWCATMAESRDDFVNLITPLYKFCNETSDRLPFTDWYDTKTAKCIGFRARPVIGGIFIKFLTDKTLSHKWNAN